jgi:hypothetical protein
MTDLERIALNVIAERARRSMQDRAEREWWQDWSDTGAYRRFVATLRSGRTWVGCNGSVFCRVTGPDVDIWGYVAADALDHAGQDLGDGWTIEDVRPGICRLTRRAAL